MAYGVAADSMFYLHGIFVVLIVPSTVLLVLGYYRRQQLLWHLHNTSVAISLVGQALLFKCPLVALEETFRARAGAEMAYSGSYVRYVVNELTGLMLPTNSVMLASFAIGAATIVAYFRYSERQHDCLDPAQA